MNKNSWIALLFILLSLVACTTAETTPSPTPSSVTASPIITEKEVDVLDAIASTEINTASVQDCDRIFETSPWCGVVSSAWQVTRQEWVDLFPQAEFFVVKRMLFGDQFPKQRSILVVKQDGRTLSLNAGKAFEQLMEINNVVISEENQEAIGHALVLMYLPDYLENEIVFEGWQEGNWPAPLGLNYNYTVNVQTDIKEWGFEWLFWFHEGQLMAAQGRTVLNGEVDIQEDDFYPPPDNTLIYWKK